MIHSFASKARGAAVVVCCVLMKSSPEIDLRSGGFTIAVKEVCSIGVEKLLARHLKNIGLSREEHKGGR